MQRATMGTITTLRIAGLAQIGLGLLFWTGHARPWIPLHMILGLVIVLLLWSLAGMAAIAGVALARVGLAIAWGGLVVALGLTQTRLLPGGAHWVVQVAHLVVGVIALGLGDMLAAAISRARTAAVAAPIAPNAGQPGRRGLLIGGVIVVMAIVGLGATGLAVRDRLAFGAPVVGVTTIAVRDNSFTPAAIAVTAGTPITWRWEGSATHNVVGTGFASPVQRDGEFQLTFAEPGTYAYACTLHVLMRGEIVVLPATSS